MLGSGVCVVCVCCVCVLLISGTHACVWYGCVDRARWFYLQTIYSRCLTHPWQGHALPLSYLPLPMMPWQPMLHLPRGKIYIYIYMVWVDVAVMSWCSCRSD